MRPEESSRALDQVTERARAAANPDPEPLVRAAKEAASIIRGNASAAHHSIAVRVVAKHNGVRVTITGRHAERYKALLTRELDARMPGARAEIRTMATRGGK